MPPCLTFDQPFCTADTSSVGYSNERYSTRCPICREWWLGPWQPSLDVGGGFDDNPLSTVVAPRLRVRTNEGVIVWDNMRDLDLNFADVLNTIEDAPDDYFLTGTVSLQALIELLQHLQEMHDLGNVDDAILNCVLDITQAVGQLWRKLDERMTSDS